MRGATYISGMTNFDSDHPRDSRSKQFVEKVNSAPTPDVLGPGDATVKQLLSSPGGPRGGLTRGVDDFELDDLLVVFKDYDTGKALRLYRDPDDPEGHLVSNGIGRVVPFRASANAHVFDLTKEAREFWAEEDESRMLFVFDHDGRELELDAPDEGSIEFAIFEGGNRIAFFEFEGDRDDHFSIEEAARVALAK